MHSVGFRLKVFLALLATVMLLGTLAFAYIENLPFLDALYFSIVTVATVGYGDIHPTSTMGKILAISLIITGVGTFLEVIAGTTQYMLNRRDREIRMEKLNIIVGLFFSEIGTNLLRHLVKTDAGLSYAEKCPSSQGKFTDEQFSEMKACITGHEYYVDINRANLEDVRTTLERKGDLLLRLLENPTLLEHESFTELLRSIFHLRDELLNRDDLLRLPEADRLHLEGDLVRVYRNLAAYWLQYMDHLKRNYPYLFSLALRTNPFDPNASPIFQ